MDSLLNKQTQMTIEKIDVLKVDDVPKVDVPKVDVKKLSDLQKLQYALDEWDEFDKTLKGTTITYGGIEYKR